MGINTEKYILIMEITLKKDKKRQLQQERHQRHKLNKSVAKFIRLIRFAKNINEVDLNQLNIRNAQHCLNHLTYLDNISCKDPWISPYLFHGFLLKDLILPLETSILERTLLK
jgi:hypothetical protein